MSGLYQKSGLAHRHALRCALQSCSTTSSRSSSLRLIREGFRSPSHDSGRARFIPSAMRVVHVDSGSQPRCTGAEIEEADRGFATSSGSSLCVSGFRERRHHSIEACTYQVSRHLRICVFGPATAYVKRRPPPALNLLTQSAFFAPRWPPSPLPQRVSTQLASLRWSSESNQSSPRRSRPPTPLALMCSLRATRVASRLPNTPPLQRSSRS